ncbi:MAG TPA: LON peptidase substrate-binding domain-containing protein, partial [Thermodesulfobacteriota bacterium]|nr:LON peptidase substrate-binding domain-containing protein [Thermodesulfobacteriota bacterium]
MFFTKKEEPPSDVVVSLPLLPLRDIVVFPHMVVPLFVGRDRSIKALEAAMKGDKMIFLASQRNAQQTSPQEEEIFTVGTMGQIIQMLKLPDNTIKVFVEGRERGRILRFLENDRFFQVEVVSLGDEIKERDIEVQALVRGLKAVFDNYLGHNKKIPQEFVSAVRAMNDPARLTDTIAGQLNLKMDDKQYLLERTSLKERIERLLELMQSEIEIGEIEKKIRERVKKQMEKSQKEYYLNEQMRAIQKEMGDKDDFKSEIAELEEQLAKKNLPSE